MAGTSGNGSEDRKLDEERNEQPLAEWTPLWLVMPLEVVYKRIIATTCTLEKELISEQATGGDDNTSE